MDGRRRHWFALYVHVPRSRFGTAVVDKFGRDGILTWICYLAACKRSQTEGQIVYGSEPEAWMILDLDYPEPPGFTLRDFFTFTGRHHQTRRHKIGRLTRIECVHWDEWQNPSTARLRAAAISSEDRPVPSAGNGTATSRVVAVLATIGDPDSKRVEQLVASYPDIDHYALAVSMADYLASPRGRQKYPKGYKDITRAYGNWLKREKPKTDVSPYKPLPAGMKL